MFGQCGIIARRFTSLANLASQKAACPALWGNEKGVKGTVHFKGRGGQVLLE